MTCSTRWLNLTGPAKVNEISGHELIDQLQLIDFGAINWT